MDLIADLFLIAAALGAGFYCFTLSRRLSALNSAEGGIGKAIGTLSEQVTRLEKTLDGSRERAEQAEQKLRTAIERAENLESMISRTLSATPTVDIRPSPKAAVQKVEAQPASFRRRLFSDSSEESRQ